MISQRKWTEKEIRILKENNKNMLPEELSSLLNRSPSSIENKRFKLGLIKNQSHPIIQIGQRFLRLIVIKESDRKDKNGQKRYICQCDCGKMTDTSASNLRLGQTRSCGCFLRETVKTVNRLDPGEVSYNQLEGSYKESALKRGIPYSLSTLEFRSLITQNCYWCGIEPRKYNIYFNKVKKRIKTCQEWADQQWISANGIDRVDNDPTIGYKVFNCVSCCKDCNVSKGTKSVEEFLKHTKRILDHQNVNNK
jgi:hypothetical protein